MKTEGEENQTQALYRRKKEGDTVHNFSNALWQIDGISESG